LRRMSNNSVRYRSKLVWVYPENDCACIEGKRWPNTMLIKKCVEYL
jgi:hypothetical protein